MKNLVKLSLLILAAITFTNCATIVGGSRYYANVRVEQHPNAKIEYKGMTMGTGQATFKVKRAEADRFSVTIRENGCDAETTTFRGKKLRGWALVGTFVSWTWWYGSLPLAFGVIVDGIDGALWKPDENENGITKQDYNNYNYIINYKGCKDTNSENRGQN